MGKGRLVAPVVLAVSALFAFVAIACAKGVGLDDLYKISQIIGAIASCATAAVAVWAASVAYGQLNQTRENSASDVYPCLLEEALEHPDFVAPEKSDVDIDGQLFLGDRTKFRQYEAFVDLMMTTFEMSIKSAGYRYQ